MLNGRPVMTNSHHRITYKRPEGLNYYISFIVWPFGVLLAALRHWERPWSKNVFWLFCIFFGYTFIIAKDSYDSADSVRYAQMLVEYAHSDISAGGLWRSFYSEGSNYIDIAQPVITYLVSRVTDNPTILFTIFGLIFGYFYSRNIWFVLDQIKGNFTIIVFLYFLTFALFNPIWNINGFRMWTAAQIFLFGALPYLLKGNSKRLFWCGVSVFFHFSFLYPLATLFIYIFLKNRLNIYLVFFIVTCLIKEINLQQVQSVLSFLPGIFQQRVGGYTNLEYAETINIANQSANWYLTFSSVGIKWVTYSLTLFIYFFCKEFLKNRKELMTLFCYSLLLYGFANVISLLPSGSRFLLVANTFMFAFFIIFISTSPEIRGLLLIKVLSIPLLLLFCVFTIRVGMDYFGLVTIFGNPLLAALDTDIVPLITGIKRLF